MNDLRQLRHFVALAEHGHFARAAEAVHLSQPALSRSIQALEASLGCVLVDRHSRGISLTAHGRLVLEHARRLLAGSQALSNAVGQLGNLASGELRLGAVREGLRIDPDFMAADGSGVPDAQTTTEWLAHASLVMDQLDFASFPSRGWRVRAALAQGRRWADATLLPAGSDRVRRLELDATAVTTRGRNTLEGHLRLRWADQTLVQGLGQYWLGGFQNLSGYKPDQLNGNQVLLGRVAWYRRLNNQPVLTRGFFAGMTLEAGNAWATRTAVRGDELRWGGSLFVGADTGLGPLYLGVTGAPKGSAGLYLLLGRP